MYLACAFDELGTRLQPPNSVSILKSLFLERLRPRPRDDLPPATRGKSWRRPHFHFNPLHRLPGKEKKEKFENIKSASTVEGI
jgi:hypothetical protein